MNLQVEKSLVFCGLFDAKIMHFINLSESVTFSTAGRDKK
jgi:hypothetical protein